MVEIQIKHLINKVFKILPLVEEENENVKDYINSVVIQIKGAKETSKEFFKDPKNEEKLTDILNSINYLKTNDFTVEECKKEVFKCISILEKFKEV